MPPNSLFISLPDGMVCRHPVRFSSVALLCLVILQGVLYSLLSCCLHAAAIMRKTSPVHPDPGSDVTQLNLRFAHRRARINRLPHGLPPCTVFYDGYCDKAICSSLFISLAYNFELVRRNYLIFFSPVLSRLNDPLNRKQLSDCLCDRSLKYRPQPPFHPDCHSFFCLPLQICIRRISSAGPALPIQLQKSRLQ
jgi:hypothetical protein